MHIAASLLILLVVVSASADAGPVQRLRGGSGTEARLIQTTVARSPTARALAEWIERSDLIVYVQLTADLPAGRAATRLVTATPESRYLRIVMGAMTHPVDRAALLAHELQHAVEIGQASNVRTNEALRRLYEQIGEDRWARNAFETEAAREVAARVQREVSNPPRVLPETRQASGS